MNRLRRFATLGLCCMLVSPAGAEQAATDVYFTDEIPLVLSATRLAQPQTEAPASITIIDRALIRASGAKEIPELFRLVPGMQVAHVLGNRPIVAYHGLTDENPQGVQVIIDGRSVYVPIFGGVDWVNLPLMIEDIERIEVIRGPNSSSFGSNSFQSVINITTIHGSQNQGSTVKATLGERDYERTFFRYGDTTGDLDYRVSVSHLDDGNYEGVKDDTRQNLFSSRFDYQLTPFDSLQMNLGLADNLRQVSPEPLSPEPTDPARTWDESNHFVHGRWEHHDNDGGSVIGQLSYSVYNRRDKFVSVFDDPALGPGAVYAADNSAFSDRWDFELEHQFHISDSARWVWGLGVRHDRVELPFWFGADDQLSNDTRRLFANLEWRFHPQFILNLGALWEDTQISGDELAPKLALNYLPSKNHGFRLIASRSMRTPVLAEENFNSNQVFQSVLGEVVVPGLQSVVPGLKEDSNLNPETVDLLELGYHGLYLQNRVNVDFKLFYARYEDLIDYYDYGDIPNRITLNGMTLPGFPVDLESIDNLYSANSSGFELELNYRPDTRNLIHAGYAYNRTRFEDFKRTDLTTKDRNQAAEAVLGSAPKDTINVLVMHTFDNDWWASLGYYFTGSMEYLGGGNPQGPFRKMDINVGKTYNTANRQQLELEFSVQLALDQDRDYLRGYTFENRAFMAVKYTFE